MGLTEIEHSFAASPTIFWPLASTFAWKLVNEANCEIIRGEVSMMRGGAGGLSYVSSGTSRGTLCVGASWPEARGSKNSDSRQVERVAFNILKWIIIRNSLRDASRLQKQTTAVKAKRGGCPQAKCASFVGRPAYFFVRPDEPRKQPGGSAPRS